ncbi:MAG: hypothetical protein M1837_000087 [Sclerophora amabilis]|nr:MAG: hypothetical protein M1837_000087 [Sclerophora amabilis]
MFPPGELYSQIRRRPTWQANPPNTIHAQRGQTSAQRSRARTFTLRAGWASDESRKPAALWDSGPWKDFKYLSFSPERSAPADEAWRIETDERTRYLKMVEEDAKNPRTSSGAAAWDSTTSAPSSPLLSGHGSGKHYIEDPELDDSSILIYLDEDSPQERERVELVFINPVWLDVGVVKRVCQSVEAAISRSKAKFQEQIRIHLNESAESSQPGHSLSFLVDDLEAVTLLSNHEKVSESIGISSNFTRSFHWLQHLDILHSLLSQKVGTRSKPSFLNVLSDPVIASLWIRESLQDKWKQKYKATLATRSVLLKKRASEAELLGDEDERKSIACRKRRLTRTFFDDCVTEELRDISNALKEELRKPIEEVENLYTLYESQQYLLCREQFTISELVDSLIHLHVDLSNSVEENLGFVNDQADALDGLMHIGRRTASTLETRINRLSAKDVQDLQDREKEKQDRLRQPEALLYLSKACEDLQSIREYSQALVTGLKHIYQDLEDLAGQTLDLEIAAKGCLVFLEDKIPHAPGL